MSRDKTATRCDECRYWVGWVAENPSYGYCHRFPPTITAREASHWPMTFQDFWCGEWGDKAA